MPAPKPMSDMLYVRVTAATKKDFFKAAARLDVQPSELLRELVQAIIDGRVTVTPPQIVMKEYHSES